MSLEAFEDLECLFALLDVTYNSAVLNLSFKNSSPYLKNLLLDNFIHVYNVPYPRPLLSSSPSTQSSLARGRASGALSAPCWNF